MVILQRNNQKKQQYDEERMDNDTADIIGVIQQLR